MTTDAKTHVIYARVPERFKREAEAYADERGSTLTSAVVALLERGLSEASDDQSVAQLQTALDRAKVEKDALRAELRAAQRELKVVEALAQRAQRPVGKCPGCQAPITGYDLLGTGECPKCNQDLSPLVVPNSASSTLNQRDLLILVGALGAVLGVAYLASK